MQEKILVSACLLGTACRYDGASRGADWVMELKERFTLVPLCPEVEGGLPTPRPRAERRGDRVINELGTDVTDAYRTGAVLGFRRAREQGCIAAILKAKSPSCGKGRIYDGTFSGRIVPGDGVAAQLLQEVGIPVFSEEEREEFFKFSERMFPEVDKSSFY